MSDKKDSQEELTIEAMADLLGKPLFMVRRHAYNYAEYFGDTVRKKGRIRMFKHPEATEIFRKILKLSGQGKRINQVKLELSGKTGQKNINQKDILHEILQKIKKISDQIEIIIKKSRPD